MTKEELLKQLKKEKESTVAKFTTIGTYAHGMGYVDGLKKAIGLAEKLDEPKQVIIPEFIANDIKYHKKHGYTLLGALGSTFDQRLESDVYCWFFADDGSVKKYINAWNNGYEVEKEPKYFVRVKGFKNHNEYYINYSYSDKIICLNDKYVSHNFKTIFTKQWLKDNWSEYDDYNNAGLLEFEEVGDD